MAARGDGNHLGALPLRQLHGEMTDSPAAPLTRRVYPPAAPADADSPPHARIDHELPAVRSDIGTAAAC